MKKLLAVLILVIFSPHSYARYWNETTDYRWQYRCKSNSNVTAVVFILHGASDTEKHSRSRILSPGMKPMLDDLLSSCVFIVVLESGTFKLDGIHYRSWDFTGEFTHGAETTHIVNYLLLAKKVFNRPVYLVGGSAGGIMAYGVITKLKSIGKEGLLNGVVLAEAISPNSLSVTASPPSRYAYLNSTKLFTSLGTTFYRLDSTDYNYVQLGLNSNHDRWPIPTLLVYSENDAIIPEKLKKSFAEKLLKIATNTSVFVSGYNHDIGLQGWWKIRTWLFKQMALNHSET